jgi:hypothetical protein
MAPSIESRNAESKEMLKGTPPPWFEAKSASRIERC